MYAPRVFLALFAVPFFTLTGVCGFAACHGAGSPADAGAVTEAGTVVVTDVCSLIEGIDNDGTIRSVCATVEEVAQIIAFILTLRTVQDAGAPGQCTTLPNSTFCATSPERAKAITFVVRERAARLMLRPATDGGR